MTEEITYNDFLRYITKEYNEMSATRIRLGQCAFFVLHRIRPDIARKIGTSSVDPYYNDANYSAFLREVENMW